MQVDQPFLFFASSLGVFNAVLMACYFLLVPKSQRVANVIFGLLLLALAVRIGKAVFFYFIPSLPKLVLQIGLSACLFIGPLLWIYLNVSIDNRNKLKKLESGVLLSLLVLVVVVGTAIPYAGYREIWSAYIVQSIYLIWLFFLVLSCRHFQILGKKSSIPRTKKRWLLIVLVTNVLVCLVFHSILYLRFPSYILGPIAFSLSFYVLLGFMITFPDSRKVIEGRSQGIRLPNHEVLKISDNLRLAMEKEYLYRNRQLKLGDLANYVGVSSHQLSHYLNDTVGKSFSDFVNEYRIRESTHLLVTNTQYTIAAIASEVGFGSKSAFNTAFKKFEGTTPSAFIKSVKNPS